MSSSRDGVFERGAGETPIEFHDATSVEPVIEEGPWRLCWLSKKGCWRLDHEGTGMIITFDEVLLSGGAFQFSEDGHRTGTFIQGVFPEELSAWLHEVEHTGEHNDPPQCPNCDSLDTTLSSDDESDTVSMKTADSLRCTDCSTKVPVTDV